MADEQTAEATEQTETESWRDGLPDDLKASETLGKFAGVGDLAQSYVNLEKSAGDRVAIPGEDASDEDRTAFFAKLGRPEKVEDYEAPKELPEGIELNEDLTKAWFDTAHKLNLTRQQAAGAMKFQAEMVAKAGVTASEATTKTRTDAEATLKGEWGGAYDEKVGMANEAIARLEATGATGLKELLSGSELGNHPSLVKAFASMGKYMVQDQILGVGAAPAGEMTPSEASKALAVKMLDDKWQAALYDPGHAAHKEVAAEYEKLQRAKVQTEEQTGPIKFDPVKI